MFNQLDDTKNNRKRFIINYDQKIVIDSCTIRFPTETCEKPRVCVTILRWQKYTTTATIQLLHHYSFTFLHNILYTNTHYDRIPLFVSLYRKSLTLL